MISKLKRLVNEYERKHGKRPAKIILNPRGMSEFLDDCIQTIPLVVVEEKEAKEPIDLGWDTPPTFWGIPIRCEVGDVSPRFEP